MSGAPKPPPPRGPSNSALQSECVELHEANERLLKENIRLRKALNAAHKALDDAHLPIPPEPEDDPESAEGGTRRRHVRHRRKRTGRVPRK